MGCHIAPEQVPLVQRLQAIISAGPAQSSGLWPSMSPLCLPSCTTTVINALEHKFIRNGIFKKNLINYLQIRNLLKSGPQFTTTLRFQIKFHTRKVLLHILESYLETKWYEILNIPLKNKKKHCHSCQICQFSSRSANKQLLIQKC